MSMERPQNKIAAIYTALKSKGNGTRISGETYIYGSWALWLVRGIYISRRDPRAWSEYTLWYVVRGSRDCGGARSSISLLTLVLPREMAVS